MIRNTLAFVLAALCVTASHAQASSAKKDLIAKVLQAQRPAIESIARNLAEQPAADLLERAGAAIGARIAPDKRDAVARQIQADARKYVDEAVPYVREQAVRLGPSTIGALLDERLSEDELRQLLAILESPVYAKFQTLGAEMQEVLGKKLIADTQSTIEPKIKALEQTMASRLGLPSPGAARPAARAASRADKAR
ncbi:MAG: hypothetical protein Q8K31_03420 [Burkholderiaceae bacterium]|nr:hypothetical protein [Burkholderiaceae bacterium]MDO9089625.1 hypothetical protein [Burkholderiaceae bacterium]MDP1968221.1 hypothetical protein [Burkholderiaceae bacterium]